MLSFQMFLESTRTTQLSEDRFWEILNENCKNFSFSNDLLWRAKMHTSDFQLFEPKDRKQNPVAFPKYFNRIADESNYPVKRKKSLIGGTSKKSCEYLIDSSTYMIIPFDNSELIFCPAFDLWSAADDRKGGEMVNKRPVEDDMFIKVSYIDEFKVPYDDLSIIGKKYNISKRGGRIINNLIGGELGYEFFTSSKCLLIHESKIDWLKSKL